MKIHIYIEHDIVIRHFVHSSVFLDLITQHNVTFVFPEPGYKRVKSDVSKLDLLGANYTHLTVHQERLALWKRLFIADTLRWRPGRQFAYLRNLRRETIGKKASLLFSFLSLPGVYDILKSWTFSKIRRTPNNQLETLLDQDKPDVVIHPSILEGVYINDLVAATKERNIPMIVIMNSWDNPSSKKAMVGNPDWLLVWGEQTKRHALQYMGMNEVRVIKFGAAQFDIYKHAPRITRDTFCKIHDINPVHQILLYAGSSKDTNEFDHLRQIDDAIEMGSLQNITVVYRPHPWGGGGTGGEHLLDHPWKNVRIEESMRGYLESLRKGDRSAIYLADYRHTHDVLSSVDAVVSPLSTILIEGALHEKPVMCFLPENEAHATHFQISAPLAHFEDMYKMPEFLVARGNDELLTKLIELMERSRSENASAGLKDTCSFFVEPYEESYSRRIASFVNDVLQNQARKSDH